MKVLITGITGFIGGHVCQRLMADGAHTIVGLVRPNTPETRYHQFRPAIQVNEIDLTDRVAIDALFAQQQFDWVLHIAALRGGGAASRAEFDRSNIDAPLVLANAALKYGARFVLCSSVGVFGTIPQDLPPTEATPKVGDNYYHFTKIEAERRLSALQTQGLQLVIVRPIITYGIGDRGFPFLLIKLTEHGLLLLPTQDIQIHFVDVRTLAEAFAQILTAPDAIGKTYTITDRAPVSLHALVNHIASRLIGRPYPGWKRFPTGFYRLAEFGFAHVFKSEAWLTRVQLMSRDWYYDGTPAARDLRLQLHETIPNFDYVIDWYQHRKER
jgi:nucleoside-diphosphate-sugar epimerase